jgi:metallophosphoesterase (TIGR00282 family)
MYGMTNRIKIIFIGDVVGRSGRHIVKEKLPELKQRYGLDFVFCNAENSAGGIGITAITAKELLESGVDGITLGNHIWGQRIWLQQARQFKQVCKPLNAPAAWPGYDHVHIQQNDFSLVLISLMGQAFIQPALANPFRTIREQLPLLKDKYQTDNVIVDFHAESTAEKITMGYLLEDKVSAVLGTHTHVQTADEKILGNGTAFICDVGMTGPMNGVLGMSRDTAVERALNLMPASYRLEKDSLTGLNAVVLSLDPQTGKTINIERIQIVDNVFK